MTIQEAAIRQSLANRPGLTELNLDWPETAQPSNEDIHAALTNAWQKTRGTNEDKNDALATIADILAITAKPSQGILDVIGAMLAELGYFRGLELLQTRYSWTPTWPTSISHGAIARGLDNRLDDTMEDILTDFQRDFKLLATGQVDASISAPTSAGKSFVMSRLARLILNDRDALIAYVVPTRALIREVSARIREDLRIHGIDALVRTTPVPMKDMTRGVYVVTQERLIALLHNQEEVPITLDVVIIDEAHEVRNSHRGIILEDAIQEVAGSTNNPRMLFASPHIANPRYLLRFREEQGETLESNRSPVIHRRWYVKHDREPHPSYKNRYLHYYNISTEPESEPLVRIPLSKAPNATPFRKATQIAMWIHEPKTTTLIYSADKPTAEKIAQELAQKLDDKPDLDERVESLAQYITEEVHELHLLPSWLRKGIAIHYRALPPIVRQRIEELAGDGLLDYIACTSTLLQGVNLPCRNIILTTPLRGKKQMSHSDVRNLIGRSGRMDHDLEGHVWIIEAEAWPEKQYEEREPEPVESAFDKEMRLGAPTINQLLDQGHLWAREDESLAAAALGRANQIVDNQQTLAQWLTDSVAKATAQEIEEKVREWRKEFTCPPSLLRTHASLDPRAVDQLYKKMVEDHETDREEFRKWVPREGNLTNFRSLTAYMKYTLDRMTPILGPRETDDDGKAGNYRFIRGARAANWILSPTLKTLLAYDVKRLPKLKKYKNKHPKNPVDVTYLIHQSIQELEDDVRFTMAQQYRLVMDIIQLLDADYAAIAKPIHLFLEFGTKKQEVLDIVGLGFTRSAATTILEQLEASEFTFEEPEDILTFLQQQDTKALSKWSMSPETWLEICLISGRDAKEVRWRTAADEGE